MLFQNMSPAHIEYFQPKKPKTQPNQEGLCNFPLSPDVVHKIARPTPRGKQQPYLQRQGTQREIPTDRTC